MKCGRTDCPGTTDTDGVCEICLLEPPTAPPARPSLRPATFGAELRRKATGARPAVPPPTAPMNVGPWWGLDLLPAVHAEDARGPEDVMLTDPSALTGNWKCRRCGRPVGRARHGQESLRRGRCQGCGTGYSTETYAPRLHSGDLVDGRYEVRGCIGQGGVGWVYAALDKNLDDRWVALKGLINGTDEESQDAIKDEKHYLLSIDHERIVRIGDSVFHTGGDFYLVMEFIRGYTLSDLRFERHSLEEVIACVLQILQAFDHLHRHDYRYCDLKPSNVMLSPSGVKLIDLGAINSDSRTEGFDAPEFVTSGPSVAADLYTVGRTLEDLLEQRERVPLSLKRVVACAKRHEPSERFGSASAFADQLSGVLSEIVASRHGPARQVPSRLFAPGAEALDAGLGTPPPLEWWTSDAAQRAADTGECRPLSVEMPDRLLAAARLPEPHPDPLDTAAGFLATSVSTDPAIAADQLAAYTDRTPEILLRLCRVQLSLGRIEAAGALLDAVPEGQDGWRRAWLEQWHRGLIALASGKAPKAARHFDDCAKLIPGETAPRYARALCEEYHGQLSESEDGYTTVWKIDRSYEGAVFGQARVRLRLGDRTGAVTALDRIPGTSPYRRAARIAAIRVLSGHLEVGDSRLLPDAAALREAAERLTGIAGQDRGRLRASILEAALELTRTGGTLPDADPLISTDGEPQIRAALEHAFRGLRGQTTDRDDQIILTDLANRVRPRTLR